MLKKEDIKVGTVLRFKFGFSYMGNRALCYEVYEGGFGLLYGQGQHDGFALRNDCDEINVCFEPEPVGFLDSMANYEYTGAIKLINDYHEGLFEEVFRHGDKRP